MTLGIEQLSIDAVDPRKLAEFWAHVLDWEVEPTDDEEEIFVEPKEGAGRGGLFPGLLFLKVPEPKTVKDRLHLDLRPADQDKEVARVQALGATRVDVGQGAEVPWVVLADPEGNEFCILSSASA